MGRSRQFERLVIDALDALPPDIARHLDNVEVLVEPRLSHNERRAYGFDDDEEVYGLYEGVPLTERSVLDSGELPAIITIFQEPLMRDFPEPDELRAEVRRTLLHELAHHLGISDERLMELGAY